MNRVDDIVRFYGHLDELERSIGGKSTLAESSGRMNWPLHGVYFFFENGEDRFRSGDGPRVVRIGTHALTTRSRTKLWNRLAQHRGTVRPPGGNHRGSIFRLLVGEAMMRAGSVEPVDSWGKGSSAPRDVRQTERPAEVEVSRYIGAMPFLVLSVPDDPGPDSKRACVERNAIALLSGYAHEPIDPPTSRWLGVNSGRERVFRSGLWNNNHVDEDYSPEFLNVLGELIAGIK